MKKHTVVRIQGDFLAPGPFETPEKELLVAILVNALTDSTSCGYELNRPGLTKAGKRKRAFEALSWLASESNDPWSARWILEHLTDDVDHWQRILSGRAGGKMSFMFEKPSQFRVRRKRRIKRMF